MCCEYIFFNIFSHFLFYPEKAENMELLNDDFRLLESVQRTQQDAQRAGE